MKVLRFVLVIFLLFLLGNLNAKELNQRNEITKNLRCLICQGQSVYDSDSEFANSLKTLVDKKLEDGLSEEEIYEYFELYDLLGKKTGELSSGQKTKVALAKALINKPEILLLDEPTASLDPVVAEYLKTFIYKYKKNNNISILFSSHNMKEAQRLCDKIMILKKGEVIEQGKVNFILDKYNKKKLEDVYFEIFGEK